MINSTDALMLLLQLLSPATSIEKQIVLVYDLDESGWSALVMEAQKQNVEALLFLTLNHLLGKVDVPDMVLNELHNAYLSNAARNTVNLHSAGLLLETFKQAGIQVIGLKGIYLLENLYGDVGARPMNDIDILVHKRDLSHVLDVLGGLGYEAMTYFDLNDPNIDIKHVPPMTKPGFPALEVHWTLLEEDEPFTIDAEALWQRSLPTRIAGVDVKTLGFEDLIAHLCLHLTYQHYLRLGLRGLYDIALVIHKPWDEIDWQKLIDIAKSWKVEKVVALTLALVKDLLGVDVPADVEQQLLREPLDQYIIVQAKAQLLERQRQADYLTPDLVEMSRKSSLFGKLRLGLSRIFLPRLALARIYGVPPNSPRIISCYFRRFRDLVRQYGKTVRKIGMGDETLAPALDDGNTSDALHAWMSL